MFPKIIGPYRVVETLGSGGAGTVYRARDERSGEQVALKLLATAPTLDARAAQRLSREFDALVDLAHPNVVRVFDSGMHDGFPYLTMELVEGLTLRHYLALDTEELMSGSISRPPRMPRPFDLDAAGDVDDDSVEFAPSPFSLDSFSDENPSEELGFSGGPKVRSPAEIYADPETPSSSELEPPHEPDGLEPARVQRPPPNLFELNRPERVVRLKEAMLQLCEALSYIHAKGMVHRDLKPSNVMVDQDRQVRLMDFGLARFLADDISVTANRMVGTFRYMSPEQILGEKIDARADLYSLGVLLYELLCGQPPFDADNPYELWQKVLETEPSAIRALNAKADPQLARVAHRLIRKEPDDRFQTAEEVYEAINE